MFFILSKVLRFLLDPVSWILICLFLALSNQYTRKFYLKLAVLIALLTTNPFLANLALRTLEGEPQENLSKPHDIGIVLTGMLYPSTKPDASPQFHDGVDRIIEAIRLYHEGKIKKLLITGGSGSIKYADLGESRLLRETCLGLGVSESDLIIEPDSKNTYQNALFTKQKLEKINGLDSSMILITSAFHMPRSTRCFEKQGLRVTPFKTDFRTEPVSFDIVTMTPSASAFGTWQLVISEVVGLTAYKLAGYI